MPNIKAAIKWTRQTEKRTKRNLDVKTRLKTIFKKAKVSSDDMVVRAVESQFDKAAQKGIIHPNKAARKKSRLARAVAVFKATPTPVAAEKRTKKVGTKGKAKAK